MAMSDCEKCWDTPCSCGWDYRNWSQEARVRFAAKVLGIDESWLFSLTAHLAIPKDHPMKER